MRTHTHMQPLLGLLDPAVEQASRAFSASSGEDRGAILTRREVVDFILDLSGYTQDLALHRLRLVEPSFGEGDFLVPAVERLLAAWLCTVPAVSCAVADLGGAVRAVEISPPSIQVTRGKLLRLLCDHGITERDANSLLALWLVEADFLLLELPHRFTHAVGNPPYVRQELIPPVLLSEYRSRYSTMFDRADLYVPFIEKCLSALGNGGVLGFICADRWLKNQYGRELRRMVSRDYHLAYYVDMTDTPAFHSDVAAYPAVTVIRKEPPGPTRVAYRPLISRDALTSLAKAMTSRSPAADSGVTDVAGLASGTDPWVLHSSAELAVARRLEGAFPTIEEAGCSIGIGVATGADRVFIAPYESLDVEPDRKLPLVTTRDIRSGVVEWAGLGVINPFGQTGSLVDLKDYPKLAQYLNLHADTIRRRNCAARNPAGWFRTIDRIWPELARTPKLLIPDIKGSAHIVHEEGRLYPHHNLYHITSTEWDLLALRAVLQAGIAGLFVSVYSTKMRGGFLRYQAQYLRRIRLPRWRSVPGRLRHRLMAQVRSADSAACNAAVYDIYGLSDPERDVMQQFSAREGQ